MKQQTGSVGLQENKQLQSLRLISAIGIIIGCWSLLFEIYFFREFIIRIYFARIAFTIIALAIFMLSYREISKKFTVILTHVFLVSLISSFIITIYEIPNTVFINSQILSVLIFTSAIIFSWETRDQIIAAIYYNLLFAISIIFNDVHIYQLPNLFSLVLFVSMISFLSVAASFVNHKLRSKLAAEEKARQEAVELFMKETIEKEKNAQKALIEKRQKIELLAKINHEVRTPIGAILMFFDMMEDGTSLSDEEMKGFSKSIKASSQRLLNTINNFVDYASIEAGSLEINFETFNLNEEVESTIQLLYPLASDKKNELKIVNNNKISPIVFSDAGKYRQILVNIIANAIKFTYNGRITITYEVNCISGDNYMIVTTVEDTGPGIPEDKFESVFNPFVSLNKNDTENYSSGLGLSICKDLINMFKGEIKVESKVGIGTKFTIKIPYSYNYENVPKNSLNSNPVS